MAASGIFGFARLNIILHYTARASDRCLTQSNARSRHLFLLVRIYTQYLLVFRRSINARIILILRHNSLNAD